MIISLRLCVGVVCLLMFIYVLSLVKKERLLLRYSLLWLALALVLILCALFPGPVFEVAKLFGFATASNFIFVVGFVFLLLICLSLSSVISKQTVSIKNLTQRIALLEKELEGEKNGASCDEKRNDVK